MNNIKHAVIHIGCEPEKHADFRIEEGKFICNHCETDFTKEMRDIYLAGKLHFEGGEEK